MSSVMFVLGSVVGSFLNVCIHRLPRGESIILPSSRCPNCGTKLSARDLIPILGYFLLGAKCRYCRAAISPRYPLVEFSAAAGFSFSWYYAHGDIFNFIFQIIFVSILIVIFFTDFEHQVIPDGVSIFGIFSGLFFNYFRGMFSAGSSALNPFLSALWGMLLGYLLLYAVGGLGKLIFKKEAVGEGDWYLAALLGAFLGWDGMLLSVFLAYLSAAVISGILLLWGRVKFGQYIPFGPALAGGGVVTLFWGPSIIGWYLGWVFR